MKTISYIKLCIVVSVVVALTVLLLPGVDEWIETELLSFLSTNARL